MQIRRVSILFLTFFSFLAHIDFLNYSAIKSLASNVIPSTCWARNSTTDRHFIIAPKVQIADEIPFVSFTFCGLIQKGKAIVKFEGIKMDGLIYRLIPKHKISADVWAHEFSTKEMDEINASREHSIQSSYAYTVLFLSLMVMVV